MNNDKRFYTDLGIECMSLRDYFAGQVLGSLGNNVLEGETSRAVEYCYEMADLMMKEREK